MSLLLKQLLKIKSEYRQNRNSKSLSNQQYAKKLAQSSTVYVGNLSFYTTQWSVHQLFSGCGKIKKVIMGHNNKGQSCGFCFVEFKTHQQANLAVQYLSHTKLDGRIIRVDWDLGYTKGRQIGRGAMGYQKRDVFNINNSIDPQRSVNKACFKKRNDKERIQPKSKPKDQDKNQQPQY